VNSESRLAQIISELEAVGLNSLIMGGHAVRFYGVDRNTVDFDLHLAPDGWDELPEKLSQATLLAGKALVEGPSWRPNAFRRFQIGTLPSGREEWLEFWRENHLLAPFAELFSRREQGVYGSRVLPFLSLADLIRSKETERETDWQDVAFLEEFLDARRLAQALAGPQALVAALSQVRSRRGFESLLQEGYLSDRHLVRQALAVSRLSVTQAYLLPCAPDAQDLSAVAVPIEPVVLTRLRRESPGSRLHLAMVEVVRRQYKVAAQAADRANKEAIRASQSAATGPGSVAGQPAPPAADSLPN
jgi:hypothetical protein